MSDSIDPAAAAEADFDDDTNHGPAPAGAVEEEKALWEGSYSGRAMYGVWLVLLPLTLLMVGVTIWASMSWTWVSNQSYYVWLGLTLILVIMWGIPLSKLFYKKLALTYKLTSQRLVHTTGFVVRQTDQIELIDIEDVNFMQNILERMLGVGRIKIESTDRSHPELIMEGIANVAEVSNMIDRQRRDERQRKTRHVRSG